MAPVCQGDESLEQHVEALVQSRVDAEVTQALSAGL